MSRASWRFIALAALLGALCLLASAPAAAQLLARPWSCASCISNYYYFDHDSSSAVEDWHCGTHTYNGHPATDFSLSGGLASISAGHAVRAAADGVVIYAVDGNYDRCTIGAISECSTGTRCTFDTANFVAIRHSGRTTRYVHLRSGSVRVAVGDHVTCGQVIGEIGSSGCSTNAHMHFEVRPHSDSYSAAYDPFLGACSPRTASAWVTQGAYRAYPGTTCAGTTMVDAGGAALDAAVTPPDAGSATEPDASVMPDDAAALGMDGAVVAMDDAALGPDAAINGPDAASIGRDAAPATDAAPGRDARLSGGCGCRAGGVDRTRRTASMLLLAFAGLAAWISRRRARGR